MKKFKIKLNDHVRVLAGEDKGKEGKVIKILKDKDRVLVEGVNMVSKHKKPSANNPQGGIDKSEAPIHISNVSLLTKDNKTTRVGYKYEDGKKLRISKKTKEVI
ncbi:50S ribosomal protein L24 [Psychroflexus sp. ALD_RP9]|uniref:50S ribosomal protein L24 n=1 Tax=Psychroflexus sp. ALD_RP9 TaxID=2777186 RepID=UPI001A8EE09D|nr:50S ribosomal protein L24 [Psychroflexus sp. ALD_RP9]QSS97738.1 50S ribosomal protein L24 [Psychroflexus sp. ALD_RP9]